MLNNKQFSGDAGSANNEVNARYKTGKIVMISIYEDIGYIPEVLSRYNIAYRIDECYEGWLISVLYKDGEAAKYIIDELGYDLSDFEVDAEKDTFDEGWHNL